MMPVKRHSRPHTGSSRDDMEALLGQLGDFENQINNPDMLKSPAFQQEYTLFRQYLQWRLEDINQATREELNSHTKGLN